MVSLHVCRWVNMLTLFGIQVIYRDYEVVVKRFHNFGNLKRFGR